MKDDDPWAATEPAPICQACRRMVFRTDGHRCDALRDYEWMGNHR